MSLINDLIQTLNQFISADRRNDQEKQWVQAQVTDSKLRQLLTRLSTRDIKIISQIGQEAICYIKTLPTAVNASQATISRTISRLEKDGLVAKYRNINNDKELLVRLTEIGQTIAELHTQLDQQLETDLESIAADYSPEELQRFTELMQRINQHQLPAIK